MPRKRNQRKVNPRRLGDKNGRKNSIKSRVNVNVHSRINRRAKRHGGNTERITKRRYRESAKFLRGLLASKQYVNQPVGKLYDNQTKIFFSGKGIPRQKFRTIAYLIRVQITGYSEQSKTVLWWRRIKSFKSQTLIQWSNKLKEPMYIGAIEDQVQQSHAEFIELIGLEGVK